MAHGDVDDEVKRAGEAKAEAVRHMFSSIAPRYDLLNHVLSANIDRRWRRRAVARLLEGRDPRGRFLDACAGTLDLAVEISRARGFTGRIAAVDFALPMLLHGAGKVAERPIFPVCGDALRLPFGDSTFDGATVGFGIRNVAGLDEGLAELARVLKPGGRLVILEFATPTWRPLRAAYMFYFLRVLPAIGRWVSRHGSAYEYLPRSVLAFPAPDALAERIGAAGFTHVRWEALTGGIAALHIAERVGDQNGVADVRDRATGRGRAAGA
ncbi:MAG TPA: ubiquinone/menaquinone biosynthesis methyltransferase [Longimicrobiales bacterium]|nr:ubiquinone/menaquinone biosynthesis methyltransferase [Longimicrobiales bacterium]